MCESVLVVNENDCHSHNLSDCLRDRFGYSVISAANNDEALSKLVAHAGEQPDVVLIDTERSQAEALTLLNSIRMCKPKLPVILLVPQGSEQTITQAYSMGVSDIVVKPYCMEQLRLAISNIVALQRMAYYVSRLERKHSGKVLFGDIVANSPRMCEALRLAREAANSDAPVWISGEAGTGRELLASAIHGESLRSGRPLVVIDCLKLDENHQELALFGGRSDSGGSQVRSGRLAEAGEGTIVLKNLPLLQPAVQQLLQKVLRTGTLQQVGSAESRPCRARFILIDTDKGGQMQPPSGLKQFCSIDIALPSLRERREDIAGLANHFVRMYAASEHRPIRCIADSAMEHLQQCPWQGNVRELMHVMWRAVLLSSHESIEAGDIRQIQQLQPVHYENRLDSIASRINPLLMDTDGSMKNLESIEKEVIQFALTYSGGCMTHAAKNLGIGRSTLYRRMHALKLDNHIARENQTTRPTMRISSKAHS